MVPDDDVTAAAASSDTVATNATNATNAIGPRGVRDLRAAATTPQRSSAAFLAGKKTSPFFRTKHRTRKNSSVS
jgi:2-keto-4-pentenoate hydratase